MIRRNSTQALRDAAVVFVLILLALTIRLDPSDASVDLVPEAEAAQTAGAYLPVGQPDRTPELRPAETSMSEVRVLELNTSDPSGGDGRTLCRIARSGDTIEAHCSQVGDASPAAAAESPAPCPLTARDHG